MQPITLSPLAGALCASIVLVACGGGGSGGLSSGEAQGYAADAAAMPVNAAAGLDSATEALESALADAGAFAAARMQAQAVAADAEGSASCAGGGSLDWSVTGGSEATQGNGQLDTGEVFTVDYSACVTANGPTLDGRLVIAVAARDLSGADVTLTATALQATTALGSFTSTGSVRRVRDTVPLEGGGRETTARFTGAGLTLASSIGTRQASYTLNALDWTIVRSFNGDGALTRRTHAGELDLAASTPRRPDATLAISTEGALTLGSDGRISQGLMTVLTDRNRIEVEHGGGSVTVRLDRGNDGDIDRTWTLTREQFENEAG